MARRQPRKPSIGLNSCSSRARSASLLRVGAHRRGDLGDLLLGVRQEFVQRRIEQADRHRQPAHDREQLDEVVALHRQQLGQRGAAAASRRRRGSSRARRGCGASSKNMCSVRHRPMPSAPNLMATRASGGVSALARTLSVRTSSAQPIRVANSPDSAGSCIGDLAGQHLAGRAVDGDDVALLERDAAGA